MPLYVPTSKELDLLQEVVLDWLGRTRVTKPYDPLVAACIKEVTPDPQNGLSRLQHKLLETVLEHYRYLFAWRKFNGNEVGPEELAHGGPIKAAHALHEERLARIRLHGDYELLDDFLELPWRRQITILERLGLLQDLDQPSHGIELFERSFERVLQRAGLHHFKVQIAFTRDVCALERRTVDPPHPLPPVLVLPQEPAGVTVFGDPTPEHMRVKP